MTESHDRTDDHLQELTELLRKIAEQATFDTSVLGVCQSSEYKKLYYLSTRSEMYHWAHFAQPQLREEFMVELTRQLRSLLSQHVAGDRIGAGFAHLRRGTSELTIDAFSLDVIRAAVVLGPEPTAEKLCGWVRGKTVPYQLCAVLTGIRSDYFLKMEEEGIRFEALPSSSDALIAHLPFDCIRSLGSSTLLGQIKVIIDCAAGPALYRPGKEKPTYKRTWSRGTVPDDLLDTLCESLSLACNEYVAWIVRWIDLGELEVFKHSTGMHSSCSFRHEGAPLDRTEIAQWDVMEARRLLLLRLENKGKSLGLDIAINRWRRSKRRITITDQFIELRIALEALYLKGIDQELGFRLATRGAWHLGVDFSERREYQKTLRDAYYHASKAVHGGAVKNTEKNRKLLTAAQDLCRKGILKRLDESKEPDDHYWNELILGKNA